MRPVWGGPLALLVLGLGACRGPGAERAFASQTAATDEAEIPRSTSDGRSVLSGGRDAVSFHEPEAALAVVAEGEAQSGAHAGADALRLSDVPLAYPALEPPPRPRPLLELGDPFLRAGPLRKGITLPGGARWQPSFLLYGSLRSAVQVFDDGRASRAEWTNRLDLHGDLKLSGTERLVISVRPLDDARGEYTGFDLEPGAEWVEDLRPRTTALFFEGELGELLPDADPDDRRARDWGFSVGRQPLLIQDGVLLDDDIDLVGVTRNSLTARGVTNLRLTGVFGWDEVNRADNREEDGALLFGVLAAADTAQSTMALDVLHVLDPSERTNAWYLGLSSVRRHGALNATWRLAASQPVHDNTRQAGAGTWLSAELSTTPKGTDDIAYWNTFWVHDAFTSAARGEDRAGPAGRIGLAYEPVGLGRYGVPLGDPLSDTLGTAVGYQRFLNGVREQAILELAARTSTGGRDQDALSLATRYQRALGRRSVLRVDLFGAVGEESAPSYGARLEWRLAF